MTLRTSFAVLVFVAAAALPSATLAADVKFADVVELSGNGATVGTAWRNGVDMAVAEINAKGGILGQKIALQHYDTQTDPAVSRAQVQKALDDEPYVIIGPIFSSSVSVNMPLAQQAGVPQFTGAAAPVVTNSGNPTIFRTVVGQSISIPQSVAYLQEVLKAKKVAVIWSNDDFGKGGRDVFVKAAADRKLQIVANQPTENGQADFTSDIVKLKNADADAIYLMLHEEEGARFIREARQQQLKAVLYGEQTILNPKTIELAGVAANGIRGQLSITAATPIPLVQDFVKRFEARFGSKPDHNGIQGYMIPYMIKVVTQKVGKFDRDALVKGLKTEKFDPKVEPGLLVESFFRENGDIVTQAFFGEVEDGRVKVIEAK